GLGTTLYIILKSARFWWDSNPQPLNGFFPLLTRSPMRSPVRHSAWVCVLCLLPTCARRYISPVLIGVPFVHFSPRPVARPAPRPSIAQLVERRTVVEYTDILRSLVRLRLAGRYRKRGGV